MKQELMKKMLDGITKEPNFRDQMIAERCAQIALEFFGATKPALSMSGVVGSACSCMSELDRWNCEKKCINKPKIIQS